MNPEKIDLNKINQRNKTNNLLLIKIKPLSKKMTYFLKRKKKNRDEKK